MQAEVMAQPHASKRRNPHMQDGSTALHLASREGYISTVGLLLQKGADVNVGTLAAAIVQLLQAIKIMLHSACMSKALFTCRLQQLLVVNSSEAGGLVVTILHAALLVSKISFGRGHLAYVYCLRGCSLDCCTLIVSCKALLLVVLM